MRYDWGYAHGRRPGGGGYDRGFRPYGWTRFGRWDEQQGGHAGGRGEYGGDYPGFGGWPGGARGEYYGGGGYGPGRPSQARGPGGPGGFRRYGGDYVRTPFLPEEAYRRHPELAERPRARRFEEHVHAPDDDLDDDEILEAVSERLANDPWLDSGEIEVAVEDGIVTLTGEVDDFLEARYAWDDAWETEGVRGVVNHLHVRTDQPHPASEVHGDVVPQDTGKSTTSPPAEGGGGLGSGTGG